MVNQKFDQASQIQPWSLAYFVPFESVYLCPKQFHRHGKRTLTMSWRFVDRDCGFRCHLTGIY
jgi:hypothetical protein